MMAYDGRLILNLQLVQEASFTIFSCYNFDMQKL